MSSNQGEIESSNNQLRKAQLQQTVRPLQQPQPAINHNGFTHCLTIHQILPIIYALLMAIQITLLAVNLHSKILMLILLVIYFVIFIVLCTLWYITTNIIPTDSTQILHQQTIKNKMCFDSHFYKYFCHLCQTCVSKNSFHCKKCNRCVDMFDHHCKWLNNCIGAKNYLEFLALICCTELILLFHLTINCVHVAYISKNWIFYLQAVFIPLDVLVVIANSTLLSVHLFLVVKKKTTIQLILERRKINAIHPSYSDEHQQYPQQVQNRDDKIQQQSKFQDKINHQETRKQTVKKQGKFKLSLKVHAKKPLTLQAKKTFSLKPRPRSSFK